MFLNGSAEIIAKIGVFHRVLLRWGSKNIFNFAFRRLHTMAISELAQSSAVAVEIHKDDGTHTHDSRRKLFGRKFYESIGSPKFIVAPMVDRSEFVWPSLRSLHVCAIGLANS
jgi:hypothetical protein